MKKETQIMRDKKCGEEKVEGMWRNRWRKLVSCGKNGRVEIKYDE